MALSTSPTPSGAVPADYVRLLFHYLDRRGIAAPALLGEPAPAESAPPVSAAHWRRLLERAAAHLHDPALGLHVGSTITPADLGPLGYVLLSSASAASALERYVRYQRLVHDVSPVRHYLHDGALVLEWSEQSRTVGLLVNQCGMAALAAFTRRCTGASESDAASPLAVHFVEEAPHDMAPYAQTFGCPVLFGQSATRMLFSPAILGLPMRRADAALAAMLERQADAMLAALPRAAGADGALEQQVRRLLPAHVLQGDAALDAVAAALGTSARTLRRRLQQQGLHFRALLEDTRRQLAQGYLADRRLALAEVALLLGYSEQSAFNRAAMRWTGMTPRKWRAALLAACDADAPARTSAG
ncbi:AraC family transcriptional regulator [Pseudoduganella ginsengisoli]|uniref:Helix-turn-helix domain-containing protein n=1 Tax=Pseudoduganella ginsengisoli TaxID=1462440 RepID=A0A6L6Q4I9_9BURK|nr:AraC family transcriptional regulator ligand-binding domain-containing protein [Pseudoduganella ginsengisoli]MTW04426.1 helix-turn-helix domain-containing protein [Pseudoduganella ginsengisoli]